MAKEKFQIGDSVKVNKTGKIGVINSSYSNGMRRVYTIIIDNTPQYYYSYEIQKYEKTTKRNGHWPKVILEFEQSPFKDIDSKSAEQLKHIASKINNVVKNRYGAAGIVERCIRLTLKEAQKMYNAGGKLREFALKVFTEDELRPKPKYPKTWKDYCDNFYPYEDKYMHYIPKFAHGFKKEDCDAFIAYGRLVRLRKSWIGNWRPDWRETVHKNPKYCIVPTVSKGFSVEKCYNWMTMLSFPTQEMAENFRDCFTNLLIQAENLIF